MLVDGCLIDNVPLASMHQLKSGPNLVVHFGEPAAEMFDVDYASLPGRFELIAAMLTPFRKKLLPAAPNAVNVLWRSLVAHQRYDTLPVGPFDTVMRPPLPDGIDLTDFDRHTEIFENVLPLGQGRHRGAGGGRQFGDRSHSRHRRAGTASGDGCHRRQSRARQSPRFDRWPRCAEQIALTGKKTKPGDLGNDKRGEKRSVPTIKSDARMLGMLLARPTTVARRLSGDSRRRANRSSGCSAPAGSPGWRAPR